MYTVKVVRMSPDFFKLGSVSLCRNAVLKVIPDLRQLKEYEAAKVSFSQTYMSSHWAGGFRVSKPGKVFMGRKGSLVWISAAYPKMLSSAFGTYEPERNDRIAIVRTSFVKALGIDPNDVSNSVCSFEFQGIKVEKIKN